MPRPCACARAHFSRGEDWRRLRPKARGAAGTGPVDSRRGVVPRAQFRPVVRRAQAVRTSRELQRLRVPTAAKVAIGCRCAPPAAHTFEAWARPDGAHSGAAGPPRAAPLLSRAPRLRSDTIGPLCHILAPSSGGGGPLFGGVGVGRLGGSNWASGRGGPRRRSRATCTPYDIWSADPH